MEGGCSLLLSEDHREGAEGQSQPLWAGLLGVEAERSRQRLVGNQVEEGGYTLLQAQAVHPAATVKGRILLRNQVDLLEEVVGYTPLAMGVHPVALEAHQQVMGARR